MFQRRETISLISYHYHFSPENEAIIFGGGSECKYTSSTVLTSSSILQFHLLLSSLRIQIHPLCNYTFFKRNWWECEYPETVSCFFRWNTIFSISMEEYLKSWSNQYPSLPTQEECITFAARKHWFSSVTLNSKQTQSHFRILDTKWGLIFLNYLWRA